MEEPVVEEEKWQKAFEEKIKSKPFEQFSLLMFDFKLCNSQQKSLLSDILFQNCKSAQIWEKYISYVFEKFSEKRLHLQRLVYKALELLDEKGHASDLSYLRIHLFCIQLKTNQLDKAKYFQNILWKRKIGIGFAEFYLSWAKVAPGGVDKADNADLWDEDIVIKKGIEQNAQPIELLKQNLTEDDTISDHSDGATVKVPTQDLKQAMEKIPLKRPRTQTDPLVKKKPNTSLSSEDIRKENIFLQQDKYFTLNKKLFFKLNTIGKGGSSTVFKVISATDGSLYALKTVDLSKHAHSSEEEDEDKVLESYMNEINLLKSLKDKSPYIVQLIDHQVFHHQKRLAILLELGDIDLAKLLSQSIKSSSNQGSHLLDPILVRMLWKEMLLAVQAIHDSRIIHGDLKPANFVFIKGHLKLIDFGIAKSISIDTTNIYRDSQIGTINYMAPEAINPEGGGLMFPQQGGGGIEESKQSSTPSMKVGRASDIWSLGCILYQMIYGKPPFAALNTIQKLVAIPNPHYEIPYPHHSDRVAIETIQSCLRRNPRDRVTIQGEEGLLNHRFLQFQSDSDRDSHPSSHQTLPTQTTIPQPRETSHQTVKPLISIQNPKLVLPSSLKAEIIQSENRLLPLESEEANAKASRWMKSGSDEAAGGDMKSLLEKRMNQMRKFLDIEQDNNSTTESLNFSGFFSQL